LRSLQCVGRESGALAAPGRKSCAVAVVPAASALTLSVWPGPRFQRQCLPAQAMGAAASARRSVKVCQKPAA